MAGDSNLGFAEGSPFFKQKLPLMTGFAPCVKKYLAFGVLVEANSTFSKCFWKVARFISHVLTGKLQVGEAPGESGDGHG